MADLAPAYLVTGDADLLVQRALEDLLERIERAAPDVDLERLDATTADGLPEMRTASLFGGRRCVVITGAAGLTGRLAEQVEEYLEEPAPDAVLVLAAQGTGRIRRIAKRMGEVGERIEVKLPPPWQDRAWAELVRGELQRHGRDAEPAAVAALLERAGTDATAIAMRCGQVAAAASGRITVADVERIVEGQGNHGGFAIADAIADRDPATAVTAVRGALDAGEAPLALLGAITFRIRQLLQVRGGATAKQMGTSSGMHRRLADRAHRFGPGELAWCHDRIARADLDLKGSDLPPALVIEVAVLDLAVSRDVGAPWNPLVTVAGREP